MSNLIEEQDVKSQMFPFGAFKFTDPAADATPTLSLKAPWTWSANPAFTTVTSANGTVATTDPYVQYYYSTGNSDRTCTLPAATGAGQVVAVYKTDAGTGDVDVTPAGTDKINGYNAVWKINDRFQYVVLQDRAAGEWHVLDCLGTLLEFTSDADVAAGGLTLNTWYNPTGHSLSVTSGIWDPYLKILVYAGPVSSTWLLLYACLSTANNTSSNADLQAASLSNPCSSYGPHLSIVRKGIVVSTTTTYYVNILANGGANLSELKTAGSSTRTRVSFRRIA